MHILISTGEVSGDVVGALLTRAIWRQCPHADISAIGGPRMKEAGASVCFESSHLGTVGVSEAFRTMPGFVRAFGAVRRLVRDRKPDVAVLIGNDVFHVLAGRWLKRHGVHTIAYFPPQIWVWRSLAGPIARSFDAVLTSFPDEQHAYQRTSRGTAVTFVGHYLSDLLEPRTDATVRAARAQFAVPDRARIVGLLPGSRGHEVGRLAPAFMGAARRLFDADPALRFLLPIADERHRPAIEAEIARAGLGGAVTTSAGSSHDVMRAADLLILASGTASLEATLLGVPMVIVYKLSSLTYAFVRAGIRMGLLESNTVGLPNLILGRRAVPELIQERACAAAIADEAAALLRSPERAHSMVDALTDAARRVSGGRVLEHVASYVLEVGGTREAEAVDRSAVLRGVPAGALEQPVQESE